MTPPRGKRTRLARETAAALGRLNRREERLEQDDLADFETVFPRAAIRAAAQDELKTIYDELDGVTISLDDI